MVVALVDYPDETGANIIRGNLAPQSSSRLGHAVGQSPLGKIELLRAVDQFDGAIEMGGNVGVDDDAKRRRPRAVTAAGVAARRVAAFEAFVASEAGLLGIILALEAGIGENSR